MGTVIPQQGIISGQTITRRRSLPGTYVSGRYVKGSTTDTTGILASVQRPLSKGSHVLQQLTEAQRTKEVIQVYCAAGTFRMADEAGSTSADQIIYNSITYEVQTVNLWEGQHLVHEEVLAVRVEA